MRTSWRKAIVGVLLVLLLAASHATMLMLGERWGAPDSGAAAERFAAGKAKFCDLDENARMFVCPASRNAMAIPGGAAVVYACDPKGRIGFISFLGEVTRETKTAAIAKLVESGLTVGPHCAKGSEEILWLKVAPWKTAAR